MNLLPLRTISCLISLSISQTAVAQQWQLGHQPSQYSVPQYKPANGESYPLFQEPSSSQVPPQNEPDAGPGFETAPGSLPDRSRSYPLPGTSPAITSPLDQPITPTAKPPQDPIASEFPLGEPIVNGLPVAPREPAHLLPPQSTIPSELSPANNAASNPGSFGLDYSIYRDMNRYPIDPRKPCNECVRPQISEACKCQWPGKNGRPYQDREPGACSCSYASNKNKPNFSYNWPAPFSATLKTHLSSGSNRTSSRRRISDCFDQLVDFKLIDYQRTDNGYCGKGADPYGCLGESRVAGVGFRQPGDAIQR